MIVAERLKSKFLPLRSSENGRVEGTVALEGAEASGSSHTLPSSRGSRNCTEPTGLTAWTPAWCSLLRPAPSFWAQLLPGLRQG